MKPRQRGKPGFLELRSQQQRMILHDCAGRRDEHRK
jgi:hypothetical protein